MALKPVYVDISVSGGLDAKQDRKLVKAPQTLVADNIQYATAGSVRKRYGTTFLPQPSSDNVKTLGSTNDELLSTDQSFMYSYSQAQDRWTRRGVAPHCAVGTKSLGGVQLAVNGAVSKSDNAATDGSLRNLTFDTIGDIGLLAYDSGDTYDANNISWLGTITLSLFEVSTGKRFWTTQIVTPFYNSSMVFDPMSAGIQTPDQGTQRGVGKPVIKAFKGQFYLMFTGALTCNLSLNGAPRIPTVTYFANLFRMGTPGSLLATIPVITNFSFSGCTRITFGPNGGVTPATWRMAVPYIPQQPTFFSYDLDTTGASLFVAVVSQAYGYAEDPPGIYGDPGFQVFHLLTNATTALTPYQLSYLTRSLGYNYSTVSLTHTPNNPNGTVPVDSLYVACLQDGLIVYGEPSVGPVITGRSKLYENFNLRGGALVTGLGVGESGNYQVYISDGYNYQLMAVNGASNATTVISTVKNGPALVDNAMNFGGFTSLINNSTGPYLASDIFLAPDGQPVMWVNLTLFKPSEYNCLVLVNLGGAVTPSPGVYAHCFYIRTGAALQGNNPSPVVNSSILAYQLTDKVNQTAVLKMINIQAEPYPSICRLQQGALITGGDTKYYDGKECRTLGWLKFPELPPMSLWPAVYGITRTAPTYPGGVFPNAQTDPAMPNSSVVVPGLNRSITNFLIPSVGNYLVGQSLKTDFAYSYIFVWVDYDSYGNAIYSCPSDPVYLQGTGSQGAVVSKSGVPQKSYTPATCGIFNYYRVQTILYRYNRSTGNGTVDEQYFYRFYETYNFNYTPYVPIAYQNILFPNRGKCLVYRNSSLDPTNYHRIPMLTRLGGIFQIPGAVETDYYPRTRSADNTLSQAFQPTDRAAMNTPSGFYDLSPDDNTQAPICYSQPSQSSAGGELPNDPPPPSTFAVTTTRRPFVASAENRTWLYPGKPYFPGRAPEFNAGQFLEIDPPSGDITGLAVLDQNVIVFKRDKIFVLAGDGPDATGNGTFNNTYPVATDTGCLDSQSIVTTETGVYFRSVRGIQKIDRSLQVSYPGAQVERIVNSSLITSSILVPAQNQIRWALRSHDNAIAGTGADNVVLVLDYLQDKWSQYRFNPGFDPRFSLRIAGQAIYNNNYFALAGNAIFEDAGPFNTYGVTWYTDGSNNKIPMTLETGWIPLAGPQGWGRLRRVNVLGDFKDAHNLTLSFAYDYNEDYTHSVTYSPAPTEGNPGGVSEYTAKPGDSQNWRVRAPRQVAQAVKFKLVDDGTGEAVVITGLELETSQKSGATRVPDAQSR